MQIGNLKIKTHKDFLQNCLKEWKLYELEFLELSLLNIKKNTVIIDVWANIGNHTLYWLYKDFTVVSFEPIKQNFDLLEYNINNNKLEVKSFLFNVWLWNKKEKVKFLIDKDNMWACQKSNEWTEEIQINLLDSYKIKPSLIKIDVEGFELEVLEWALQTIKKYKPDLIVECNSKQTQKFILDLWYTKLYNKYKNFYFIYNTKKWKQLQQLSPSTSV